MFYFRKYKVKYCIVVVYFLFYARVCEKTSAVHRLHFAFFSLWKQGGHLGILTAISSMQKDVSYDA